MPIDVYFNGIHGELPYRSIKFHTVGLDKHAFMQFPTPTVNFTNNGKFTRITNWVKYPAHGDENAREISVTWEEPCDYKDNSFQRYYPVKDVDGSNRAIYKKYEEMVDTTKMQFIGRCGMYVYLDMHQAVSSSMAIAKRFING
jgi:UDP-galactopyranose mutase